MTCKPQTVANLCPGDCYQGVWQRSKLNEDRPTCSIQSKMFRARATTQTVKTPWWKFANYGRLMHLMGISNNSTHRAAYVPVYVPMSQVEMMPARPPARPPARLPARRGGRQAGRQARRHAGTHPPTHARMPAPTHAQIDADTETHTDTQTHTQTHTHTHTHRPYTQHTYTLTHSATPTNDTNTRNRPIDLNDTWTHDTFHDTRNVVTMPNNIE